MRKRGLTGSFWPSRTQEALLRLALAPEVDVEKSWRGLQPLDIEKLEEGTFALLPLVYRRLQDAGVPESRLPRLAGIYRSNWVKNQLQLERLPSLLAALRGAGIKPLVVGGAAIATRYFPQLGLRPVPQLELLVSPREAAAFAEAVSNGGWRSVDRAAGPVIKFQDESTPTAVVLYAGLPAYILGPVDSIAAMAAVKEVAVEREVGGASALTLAPADELLFTCGLGARRTFVPQVQWLLDAHHIVAAGDVDWARLVARARAHRLVRPLRDTLTYLARTTAVGAAANEITRALEQERPGGRDRLAYRLAGSGLGPLGASPEGLLEHARLSLDEPLPTALRSLPSSMRDAWGLERVEQVPLVAVKKMLGRIRRAATARSGAHANGGATTSSQPVGADGRSRSASS